MTSCIFMHMHIYAEMYQQIVHPGVFYFETVSIVTVAISTLGCFSSLSIKLTLFQPSSNQRALSRSTGDLDFCDIDSTGLLLLLLLLLL